MSYVSSVVPTRLENHILVTAHHARERYFPKQKYRVPEWELVLGVYRFLRDSKPLPTHEVRAILTDSETVETPEFKAHLDLDHKRDAEHEKSFTGNKEFSLNKLAAMVTHVAD